MVFGLSDIGQFADVSVEFGDLTLLVGAQGTGKSVFLQLFKFFQDQDYIKNTMNQFGQDWHKNSKPELMEAYLGEGMNQIWHSESRIIFDGKDAKPSPRLPKDDGYKEKVYYIPAQRVLTMHTGWPQPYKGYTQRDPFVVKNFSEHIRRYLEKLEDRDSLFPVAQRIKEPIRDVLNATIFHGATLSRGTSSGQKAMKLNVGGNEDRAISYMAWSTGQREFLPLLLGCYELLPGGGVTKNSVVEWVVIEEPEMGLHPMGIFAVMSLVIDLLSRSYRVAISTHSSHVLDIVWAIESIKRQSITEGRKIELISEMLGLRSGRPDVSRMIECALRLVLRSYSFEYDQEGRVISKDISSLDPGDEDEVVAGWGGLAAYSARVSDTVAEAVRSSDA